jgi:hypothetical protein
VDGLRAPQGDSEESCEMRVGVSSGADSPIHTAGHRTGRGFEAERSNLIRSLSYRDSSSALASALAFETALMPGKMIVQ